MTNLITPFNTNPIMDRKVFHPKYFFSWIGLLFMYLISKLPLRIILIIGKGLGILLFSIAKRRRRIAELNLKLCFPNKTDKAITSLTKETFINIGIGIFEMGIGWWASQKRIRKLKVFFKNKEALVKAEKEKKGLLVLIKHSTHLELDLRILSEELSLGGMYRPQNNLVVNYFMIKARNSMFTGVVSRTEAKHAIRWIKNGLKFLYAADQDYGKDVSEFIPFFNHKAATVKLPAYLAKQDIKTVLVNIDRDKLEYQVELIEIDDTLEDIAFLTSINKKYEDVIKKFPEQYLWIHRRFKSSQYLGEDFYPKKS